MSLNELVDNYFTDKNTYHSYLDLYESLLCKKKETAKNILEIGVGDFVEKNGGSVKLWRDYFKNANIYALDILPIERVIDELLDNERIFLYMSTDAYNEAFFMNHFLSKNKKFDILLDDGPHTIESMIIFIKLYSQLMTDDGILIIEDVADWSWIDILTNATPEHLKPFIKSYDFLLNHI